VRLVGPTGEQIGIVAINDALRLAQDADLDLVEVAPTARPPVARLMDYGKFKYESALKARESRKNQAQTVIKEIKLRPKIDPHDYGTKKGHVERFLKAGDKVKVTIMFRGREQSRPELGFKLLQRLAGDVEELGFVESQPKQDGRNMIMVIGPHKRKADARPEAKPEHAARAERAERVAARNATAAASAPAVSVPDEPEPEVEAEIETETEAPEQTAPRPAAAQAPPRPATPRPATPRPSASPRPSAQDSAAPRPAAPAGSRPAPTPRPSAPRPAAPGAAPRPAPPRSAPRPSAPGGPAKPAAASGPAAPAGSGSPAPRPSAPQSGSPRPSAPRPSAPRPGAPRPSAPRPRPTTVPAQRADSAGGAAKPADPAD
jgi:translation initiation factor IF-3